jgi:predicted esterase
VRGVIGVCGGIPSDLDANTVYRKLNAEVLYLYGDTDEFYTLEKFQNFEKKLKDILPNFQSKCYAAKHEITDEMRKDMRAWLNR